jgi:Tfp pilus assembly protein PilF
MRSPDGRDPSEKSIKLPTRTRQSYNLKLMTAFEKGSFTLILLLSVAAPCFSQSAEQRQASFAAHARKAQEYLGEKRPDLAIPEFQAAASIDPENVETQGNLGVLLYFQGRVGEAIPHLRSAVERQPGLGKIQGSLGLAEIHALDFAPGRRDLEASFPLIADQRFKIEIGLELVSADTQHGDLEQAAAILAQLRKVVPDDPEVLYAAYRTYSDLAGESMLALSLAAPDSAQMHQLMAHEDTRQGNNNGAVAQFRKAIAIDPHLPVHFELAELLHTSEDPAVKKDAEQQYHAALVDNPQDEKLILRLAEIDAQKGNTKLSLDEYAKAVELQPGDADAKLGLARTLIEVNQTGKALVLLEQAVQLDPTNASAHYRLGTLYRKVGRAEDAKREIELYKKYKDMEEKLRDLYKELRVQPEEINVDEPDQK